MSFYIKFLNDNFAQKYSQNAGLGNLYFQNFLGRPLGPPSQHSNRVKIPYPLSSPYNSAGAFGCWTTNFSAGLVRIKI
jgi:hypothetical protein